MLRNKVRHFSRYQEIATSFVKNGFGYLVKDIGLDRVFSLPRRLSVGADRPDKQTEGKRIRRFLEDLGPTFIKIGQLASTRPDIVPDHIIRELKYLQDRISPVDYEEIKVIIETELGGAIDDLFESFDPSPIGVASIGQVHLATLPTGEQVAVKVQRPNVDKQIQIDLEILDELVDRLEEKYTWANHYQLKGMVDEFSKAIKDELNYDYEGRNAELMAKQFEDDSNIHIPRVFWKHSTRKVLTMEFVEGIKLDDEEKLKENNCDNEWLASQIVDAILKQIFDEGFFQADPHVGNFFALPNKGFSMIDFGQVGRISKSMKRNIASVVIAMQRQDSGDMVKAVKKMGVVPDDVKEHEWKGDIDQLLIRYYDVPFSEISLGQAMTDLFGIAHKHQIPIPSELTLVGKTLLTLEGVIEQLDPTFSLVDAAEPFGRKLMIEKYDPRRFAKEVFDQIDEYGDLIEEVPEVARELTQMVKKRKLPIEISIPSLDRLLSKMDRVSNLLSFSIILLSFSLIMTGLIIGAALVQESSVIWNIPAIEIGFIIAILMLGWMVYSIFRSGRF